jgi:hypothetical protein
MGDDALRAARQRAAGVDPAAAGSRIGAQWDRENGQLRFEFLGSAASVAYPGFDVTLDEDSAPAHVAALLVYHLALSDGSEPCGRWVSFAELPDASFYVKAFRGYTGALIARHFAPDASGLGRAVEGVGGEGISGLADRAWRVPALPKVPVALVWWDADDEFDARADLLFDSSAPHHLTTDGCAVLGSWLTSLLIRAAGR